MVTQHEFVSLVQMMSGIHGNLALHTSFPTTDTFASCRLYLNASVWREFKHQAFLKQHNAVKSNKYFMIYQCHQSRWPSCWSRCWKCCFLRPSRSAECSLWNTQELTASADKCHCCMSCCCIQDDKLLLQLSESPHFDWKLTECAGPDGLLCCWVYHLILKEDLTKKHKRGILLSQFRIDTKKYFQYTFSVMDTFIA